MGDILAKLPEWLLALAAVVTAANALTVLTPTKVDDRILAGVGRAINVALKVLNVLAGNFGKNKNADDY